MQPVTKISKHPKRNVCININDGETIVTLMKPFSGEYDGKLIAIIEDSYGELDTDLMKISEVTEKYGITSEQIALHLP